MFSPRRSILLRLLAEGRLALLKWFVIRFTIWLEGKRWGLGRGAPLAVIGADGVEPGSRKCGDSHTSEKVINGGEYSGRKMRRGPGLPPPPSALRVFGQKLLFRQNDEGRRHSGVHLHLIGSFVAPSEGPDDGLRRLGSDLQISMALPSPAPRYVF